MTPRDLGVDQKGHELDNYSKIDFFQNFQMTSKMFLDITESVITTSKLSILKTFQGGALGAPPCQIRLIVSPFCKQMDWGL